MGGETITVEARDLSDNARAELETLTLRYGGIPVGWSGSQFTVRAGPGRSAAGTLRAVLENDPRVVSDLDRDVLARAEAAADRAGAVCDYQSQLEAQNAELRARVAGLERR
jgi:hypothetical protein